MNSTHSEILLSDYIFWLFFILSLFSLTNVRKIDYCCLGSLFPFSVFIFTYSFENALGNSNLSQQQLIVMLAAVGAKFQCGVNNLMEIRELTSKNIIIFSQLAVLKGNLVFIYFI